MSLQFLMSPGTEIAMTSSTSIQSIPWWHSHPATSMVLSQEHQDHPWWPLAREGQRWDSPLQPHQDGFPYKSSWISLLPTPQLWKICSSLSWENATWEMPLLTHPSARGVLPVTVSSYFRKGDGNKWKDKVPLV